jgi:hypothetical protein
MLGLALGLPLGPLGCEDRAEIPVPAEPPITGELELELRDAAPNTITRTTEGRATIDIEPSADFGLLGNQTLSTEGRIAALPEANSTLYTAKYAVGAQSDGPCGDEPISLALSLHRQGDNAFVVGGISAYCGAGQWHGVPVRVLRLAGELPR